MSTETATPFCEAAAEDDHDWSPAEDGPQVCGECGALAVKPEPCPSAPRALVQTIEYVPVETDPSRTIPTTDESGLDFLVLAGKWESLPHRFRDALALLVDDAPGEHHCTRCLTQPVGWVDEPRETGHGVEYDVTVWRHTVLVGDPAGGPVSVQCEECAPDATPA